MKTAIVTLGICMLMLGTRGVEASDSHQQKLVTRVDSATVVMKGHSLTIKTVGMGRTPSNMGRAGRLLPRNPDRGLNKDGLLEYELVFNGPSNYSGFKMKPVAASYKERSVPPGIKGVRIFSEFNQYDALLPEPVQHKSMLPFGKKHQQEKAQSQETAGSIANPSPHPQ